MKDLKHKKLTMFDRGCARIANGPTDSATKECWAYVDALFSALGRIIYTCTLGLLLAALKGLDAGLTAFFREIGRTR